MRTSYSVRCNIDRPLGEYGCGEKLMSTRINALRLIDCMEVLLLGHSYGVANGVAQLDVFMITSDNLTTLAKI